MNFASRLRASAVALVLAISALAVASSPAHASCGSWSEDFWWGDVTVNNEHVGTIHLEEGCGRVRAHWTWDPYYRTHAHNRTTGAWVTPGLLYNNNVYSYGPEHGSLEGTDAVWTLDGVSPDSSLTSAFVWVRNTWTDRGQTYCSAHSSSYYLLSHQQVYGAVDGNCSF